MAGDRQCVHYWILDNKDVGRCRYCGRVKDFGTVLRKQHDAEWKKRQHEMASGIAGHGERRGSPSTLRED